MHNCLNRENKLLNNETYKSDMILNFKLPTLLRSLLFTKGLPVLSKRLISCMNLLYNLTLLVVSTLPEVINDFIFHSAILQMH